MDAYLKKFFWTLPVLVIVVCAYFGAKAVNHIIESKALADSSKIGKAPKVVVKPSAKKKAAATRSKKGDVIATRNMFCSACLPLEEEEDDASVVDSDRPPSTSLPLRLVATNISTEEVYSFATIQNTSTDRQGSYNIAQVIPGGGAVVRISTKYVDFENTSKKRVERLSLLSTKITARKPADKPKAKTDKPKNEKDELLAMVDEGVNKVSDTEFELDRKVVDKILANPTSVMRGARIVPSIKNGKANGFKLYAIRPNSVYAKIGLRNGDTIHSINGMELTSLDKGLEIYSKLKSASSLSVNATRRGKPVSLSYSIK